MLTSIEQVLQYKGGTVYTIQTDAMVFAALELMEQHEVGALVVLRQEEVVGIFSERDYARKLALRGLNSMKTPVGEVMSIKVCYVEPEMTVEEGLALMTEKHCRHLPVFAQGKLVGLVSIGDLVKASLDEKDFVISQLEHYIQHG